MLLELIMFQAKMQHCLRDMNSLAKTRNSRKSMPVQMSIKQDLTPTEISSVAQSLIKGDTITFFMDNCQSIYDG